MKRFCTFNQTCVGNCYFKNVLCVEKKFVVSSMFNYYDANGNNLLDREELLAIEHLDHLDRLSQTCHLSDLLHFDDLNLETNGTISKTEFFTAFSVYYFIYDILYCIVFKRLCSASNCIKPLTEALSLQLQVAPRQVLRRVWMVFHELELEIILVKDAYLA